MTEQTHDHGQMWCGGTNDLCAHYGRCAPCDWHIGALTELPTTTENDR